MSAVRLVRAGRREPVPGIGEWLVELEIEAQSGPVRGRGAAFGPADAAAPADLQALADVLAAASSARAAAEALADRGLPEPLICAAEGALVDALVGSAGGDPRAVVLRELLGAEPEPHPRPRPVHLWLRPPVDVRQPQAVEPLIDRAAPRYVAVRLTGEPDAAALEELAARLDRRIEPYHLVLDAAGADARGLAAAWEELAGRRRLWRLSTSLLFTERASLDGDGGPLPEGVRALRPLAECSTEDVDGLYERGVAGLRLGPRTGPLAALRLRRRIDARNRSLGRTALQLSLSGVPPLATPAFVQLLRTAWLADLDHLGLDRAEPVAVHPSEGAALAGRYAGIVRSGEGGLVPDVVLGRVEVTHLFAPLAGLPWPEDAEPIGEV